jgi:hypothetical protein
VRQTLSIPVLSTILVLSSGVVFPIIFTVTDRLLRELFSAFHPTLLLAASFAWLLFFYFYGIKFSLEYVTRQFEVSDKDKLFKYSNIGFTSVAVLFYAFDIAFYAFKCALGRFLPYYDSFFLSAQFKRTA